jgi:hypothetical protein
MAKQSDLAGARLIQRLNMFARHDQNMDGRLGIDVSEGVGKLILVNGRRWNLTFNDFAEQATHNEDSLHGGDLRRKAA